MPMNKTLSYNILTFFRALGIESGSLFLQETEIKQDNEIFFSLWSSHNIRILFVFFLHFTSYIRLDVIMLYIIESINGIAPLSVGL